jgi:putative flippase GtrA
VKPVAGRLSGLSRELSAFGVVGVVNTLVTYAVTNALRFGLEWGVVASTLVATCAASTVGYLGNRLWAFRHRGQRALGSAYVLFLGLNAVGLLIQLVCVGFTSYLLALRDPVAYNIALTVGIGAGTAFRFWSYRKWVFPPPPVEQPLPAQPAVSAGMP